MFLWAYHDFIDLFFFLPLAGWRFRGIRSIRAQGWMSTDDYVSSNAAFLWYQRGNEVIRCPVLQGGNAAIFDYASAGPVFGAVRDPTGE